MASPTRMGQLALAQFTRKWMRGSLKGFRILVVSRSLSVSDSPAMVCFVLSKKPSFFSTLVTGQSLSTSAMVVAL